MAEPTMSEILRPQSESAPESGAGAEPGGDAGDSDGATPAPTDQGPTQGAAADQDDGPDEGGAWTKKLALAERKKRQEIERELAEARGQLAAFERMRQQAPAPKPEPKAEPKAEEYDPEFFNAPGRFIDQRLEQRVRAVEAQTALRIEQAVLAATVPDYKDMEKVFVDAVNAMPPAQAQAIVAQGRASGSFARFAYDWAKNYQALNGVGSFDELRAKIRAEVEAEIRGGGAGEASPAQPPPKHTVTTSNAGARSTAHSAGASGHQKFSDILKGVRFG